MEPLFLAFLGHMVGDYLFQTDWMADNKKKQLLPCLIHSMIWAGCIALFTGWGWLAFGILCVIHFIQDHTYMVRNWMKLIGQERFASGPYAPWSMVIIDNTFHLLQIWLVWKFVV